VHLRDELETALREWHQMEIDRGGRAIIDYDCHPCNLEVTPAAGRLAVHRRLIDLRAQAREADDRHIVYHVEAHLAYLHALLGRREPLEEYVRATQGCGVAGWSDEYVEACKEFVQKRLAAEGVSWGIDTAVELNELEMPLDIEDVPDAIREAAAEFEPAVRSATGTDASYSLTVVTADSDAYWTYWVDGVGQRARLRLNTRRADFTRVKARQFALHEVLGHALQGAAITNRAAREDVPWVRLTSVHALTQVSAEGIGQALPLFVAQHDQPLTMRTRLDHYLQLVRATIHVALNEGATVEECVRYARSQVPFWTDDAIAAMLSDRGVDPLLRSYLWSYPAGFDWFLALSRADETIIREVLHESYQAPLTPRELAALWPAGPPIGGPGGIVRLRQPALR
jgi:hypothetical protein